ncbi:MAG: site-specific integrase [Myxococcales bacterium]|nr:site-specific integrase [Myxococcales bacterium]
MKITLRPYAKDKSRWHIDIRLMNPHHPEQELRRRVVAPAGHDQKQARAWGERQVAAILRELVGERDKEADAIAPAVGVTKPTRKEAPKKTWASMTLAEFYRARFEPEHVNLLKPATRDYYRKVWNLYVAPEIGELPLAAIDDDRISAFRARLRAKLAASTANVVLSKVAKILRFARKVRALEAVPMIESLPEPRKRPKEVLTDEQITALLTAAHERGSATLVILLLALDAGLRVSEICALKWDDIDLRAGTVLVQRSVYEGVEQAPKGKIGKIALTSALHEALAEHRLEGVAGPLVLYRCSHHTGSTWAPYTPSAITHTLNTLQASVGLKKSGPHLLRHTALTRLANLGASVYVVQAVARHAYLQTTQVYLHTQQTGLSREAATLLDRAAARGRSGNGVATVATTA